MESHVSHFTVTGATTAQWKFPLSNLLTTSVQQISDKGTCCTTVLVDAATLINQTARYSENCLLHQISCVKMTILQIVPKQLAKSTDAPITR